MQKPIANDAAPLGVDPAEDCLYLNVWKPNSNTAETKKPVMVWIYGGGFLNGGASPDIYEGRRLAEQGIVVVSFNYRVGRFGFFGYPELTRETPAGQPVVNYGYMDQIAALRWVKRNIHAFGGNPDDVTVVGESAGAMSIHTLITSPMAKGLFQKAVIQSGADGKVMVGSVASAEKAGTAFAQRYGIVGDGPAALAKLRTLSAEQVTDGLNMTDLLAPQGNVQTFTTPVQDNVLSVDVQNAYSTGQFSHVPVMIGATTADLFGANGPMMQGAPKLAGLLAAQQVPVYYYRYGYVADSERSANPAGAPHAGEIPFFMGTYRARYHDKITAQDERASRTAMGYLVNFIKSGNPNGGSLPTWPQHNQDGRGILQFTSNGGAEEGN